MSRSGSAMHPLRQSHCPLMRMKMRSSKLWPAPQHLKSPAAEKPRPEGGPTLSGNLNAIYIRTSLWRLIHFAARVRSDGRDRREIFLGFCIRACHNRDLSLALKYVQSACTTGTAHHLR